MSKQLYQYIRPYCTNWQENKDFDVYNEPTTLDNVGPRPHPDCILVAYINGTHVQIDSLGRPFFPAERWS